MKRLVAMVMAGALSTAGCAPALKVRRTTGALVTLRWDNVVALPQDTPIRVFVAGRKRQDGT
jgi:hypothetical protein